MKEKCGGSGFGLNSRLGPHPLGNKVTIQTHGQDKYGRTLADVFLRDGTNVNYKLVENGWSWWYRKYSPLDVELQKLEKEAREAKKGLWTDPYPVPPWKWRRSRVVAR